MHLRHLNVVLLHYPFMSNPRYCLRCATQKMIYVPSTSVVGHIIKLMNKS